MIEPVATKVRVVCDVCGTAWSMFADTPSQARRKVMSPGLDTSRRWTAVGDQDLCPRCTRKRAES